jgi:AraC family transcriptional regulator
LKSSKHREQFSVRAITPASQSAFQPAMHLSEDFSARSIQPKYYAPSNRLSIYRAIQLPDELEIIYTHHILGYTINVPDWEHNHQVYRFADQSYEGSFPLGSFLVYPAKTSAFMAWCQTDESIMFTIEPTTLQQVAIENDCLNINQVELRPMIVNERDPTLEFFVRAFQEEMQNHALGEKLYSESLTNLFLLHLLRHYCTFEHKLRQYRNGLSIRKFQQAIAYMQSHLAENISLSAIATELDMSQYYFCRLFKQSMGITPHQYVTQQRILRAKELLKCSGLAISDIALKCGFTDQAHLTTQFRKVVGVTPRAYRNQL